MQEAPLPLVVREGGFFACRVLISRPMTTPDKAHQQDHNLIADAIVNDWLARDRLLVHLARDHGFRVEDAANYGLAPLIRKHDAAHGGECFSEAVAQGRSEGLRRGLSL